MRRLVAHAGHTVAAHRGRTEWTCSNTRGKSCSPLLVNGLVVVTGGDQKKKSLLAYAAAARAGVATGETAVTLGAEGQGLVAGDLVNTAAIPHYFGVPAATRAANPTWVFRDYVNGGADSVTVSNTASRTPATMTLPR